MKAGKGFTLVEIVVATVIASFVAVTAVAAMRGITISKNKQQEISELTDNLRFVCESITDDLSNIYRRLQLKETKFDLQLLDPDQGGGQMLTFYTVSTKKARITQPEGDVYEVEYFIKSDDETGENSLMRRYCPVVPGVAIDEADRSYGILSIVSDKVITFTVACYDGTEWFNEWGQSKKVLPELIEINIAVKNPENDITIGRSFLLNFYRQDNGVSSTENSESDELNSYMDSDFTGIESSEQ